jgi:hypothetical protein
MKNSRRFEKKVVWKKGSPFERAFFLFVILVTFPFIAIVFWFSPILKETFLKTIWELVLLMVFLFSVSKHQFAKFGKRKVYYEEVKNANQ